MIELDRLRPKFFYIHASNMLEERFPFQNQQKQKLILYKSKNDEKHK